MVRLHPPDLSALDRWIKREGQKRTRPEAIRLGLRKWLISERVLEHIPAELDARIGTLEDHLSSSEPSDAKSPHAAMERMEHERKKHVVAKLKSRQKATSRL